MQKKGFTLIELLVVIAIIAILAAILFPVFAKAREKARSTHCQSNLRQISEALHLYFDDWDETLNPFEAFWVWGQKGGWTNRVRAYNKTPDLFHCPSDDHFFSYTETADATSFNPHRQPVVEATIADIKNPSKFIHFADSPGHGFTERDADADIDTNDQIDGNVYGGKKDKASSPPISKAPNYLYIHWPGRHNTGNNLVFFDGHVKWFNDWTWGEMTLNRKGPFPPGFWKRWNQEGT